MRPSISSKSVLVGTLFVTSALLLACDDEPAPRPDSGQALDAVTKDGVVINDGVSRDGVMDANTGDTAHQGDLPATPDIKTDAKPAVCPVFPANNPWNTDISAYPVHKNSANFITNIGAGESLHPDFGTVWAGAPNGIPYVIVPGGQPKVPIVYTDYGNQSDPGPFPIPDNAPIEGGSNGKGDRHVIAVDLTSCVLYELFNAFFQGAGKGWKASSGAKFDLKSNKLRTIGWTSADAAGLPIYPGLVRYDEVQSGAIKHALRFTVNNSQKAYVLPATHYASSSTDANRPPMGLRLRLKASVKISGYSKSNQVILKALKTYGMIVADNGSDWFLSGAPDPKWNDSDLNKLKQIKGSDFEVVDTGPIKTSY